MKLKQIVEAVPSLNKLASADLDLKTAYKISKMINSAYSDVKFFETKRIDIIKKHGDIKEDGTVSYESGNMKKAQIEVNELLDIETESVFEPVEVSINHDIKLNASDVLALKPFITFTE